MAKAETTNKEPLEKQLWKAADKLRKNIAAAEYKHVVLGLIFLKYISNSFEEHFAKLQAREGEYVGADPEDKDENQAENVFFVPTEARWPFLRDKATPPYIGKFIGAEMDSIEKDNPILKKDGGVLSKVYARQNLDPTSLGCLTDMIGNIALGDLDAAIVSVPSTEELCAMSEKMAPLLDKQVAITKQRKNLENLRDTLSPKLMSGEVRGTL